MLHRLRARVRAGRVGSYEIRMTLKPETRSIRGALTRRPDAIGAVAAKFKGWTNESILERHSPELAHLT
jgi:hypothetical protein